jgi:hypothetical protein
MFHTSTFAAYPGRHARRVSPHDPPDHREAAARGVAAGRKRAVRR